MRNNFLIISLLFAFLLLFSACDTGSQEGKKEPVKKHLEKSASPQLSLLNERIEEDPKNAELYFSRANLNLELGDLLGSTTDYRKAIQLDPDNASYYLALSDVFYRNYDLKQAIDLLEKAVNRKEDLSFRLELAKYYLVVKEHTQSLHHISQAMLLDQTNPRAYFLSGLVLTESGDTASALRSYERAVEYDSDFYEAYMQLGLLADKTDSPYTIKYFDNAIRIDTLSTEARYAKAMYYQNRQQYEEALATYKDILKVDAQFEKSYYNSGYIYYAQKDYQTAYENFNIATRLDPAYADAYYMRGLCSEEMNELDKALKDYQKAMTFSQDKHILASKGIDRLKAK